MRRTLFPGSDLLKWKDRGSILCVCSVIPVFPSSLIRHLCSIARSQEFLHYSPTVACLQEVDRIDHHGPVFRDAGYDFAYQKGYSAKLHGLCIAWKASTFDKAAEKFVKLDDAIFEPMAPSSSSVASAELSQPMKRTGCSRVTRNLGLFVALKFKGDRQGRPAGIIFTTRMYIRNR